MKQVIHVLGISLLCIAMAGCLRWGTDKPKIKTLTVVFQTDKNINRNIINQPSPIAVTVYQIHDVDVLSGANYATIRSGSLKGVLRKKTYMIWPGKVLKSSVRLENSATAIGIVANYRHLANKKWKMTQSLGHLSNNLIVHIKANGIAKG